MRRISRNSPKKRKGPEDLSDLAAWLYTDLLLGLAVAFVGAGAFAIANPNYLSPATGKVIKTFQLSCDALEIPANQATSVGQLETNLQIEIKRIGTRKGWTQVKPGVINLFGGGSTNSIGTENARRFMRTVTDKSALLKNSEILPYADNNLSTSQIKMRIYLVYKGEEKDNGCQ